MSLTVVQVAYTLAPVTPETPGGAEQVLGWIDAALTAAGHRSIVVAPAGSRVHGQLVALPAPAVPIVDEVARATATGAARRALVALLAREHVDLVHMHGLDFTDVLPPPGPPVLVTLHLPPAWYPRGALAPARPRTFLHCVSRRQQLACPPGTALLPAIENGVPLPPWTPPVAPRARLAAALGRICPEKGFHLAVDAARRADFALLIGGRVFPYPDHLRYWERELRPLLDARRRVVAPLGPGPRLRLLRTARCLLAPSLAPETSSLVAMEALAAGTPVIARAAGALADIVEPGRTGYLVESVDEMAAALERVHELDGRACREAAERRFSAERMLADYLRLYGRLAAGDARAEAFA